MSKVDLRKLLEKRWYFDGERVDVRKIKNKDLSEVERLVEIDEDELVKKYMIIDVPAGKMSKKELDEYVEGEETSINLAISGRRGYVDEEEIGKIQGCLHLYMDNQKSKKAFIEKGLISRGVRLFEVGFSRYPKAKQGQVASGLRILIQALKATFPDVPLALVGYADRENESSVRVMERAGMVDWGELVYDARRTRIPDLVRGIIINDIK